MALSAFHDHLLNTITASQMENLVEDTKIQSHKRLNYIWKNPAGANLDEVLFFSDLLKVAPYTLINEFNLGRNNISPRVLVFLMNHHMGLFFENKSTINGHPLTTAT